MREELRLKIQRLVVKLGTGVLTDERMQPDMGQFEQLTAQVAAQRRAGREVALVTSGAVGAGMGVLGFTRRPRELDELQACAAVGQSRLMAIYERLFAQHNLRVAQVLLTHDDLEHHDRHLNVRHALITLLQRGVVPIINENDAVSVTELKFGDNDRLSALVATLLPADLLVILTTAEGLMENFGQANARTISMVARIDAGLERHARGTASETAVGGMSTKLQAAKIVMRSGIPMVIASGRKRRVLERVLAGESEGTLFVPAAKRLQGRKRWIAFFHHPRGAWVVDEGAKTALRERGKSLLPPGIVRAEGVFGAGDVVRICDEDGTEFARGITDIGAADLGGARGSRTEVVHRDNLVIL